MEEEIIIGKGIGMIIETDMVAGIDITTEIDIMAQIGLITETDTVTEIDMIIEDRQEIDTVIHQEEISMILMIIPVTINLL